MYKKNRYETLATWLKGQIFIVNYSLSNDFTNSKFHLQSSLIIFLNEGFGILTTFLIICQTYWLNHSHKYLLANIMPVVTLHAYFIIEFKRLSVVAIPFYILFTAVI